MNNRIIVIGTSHHNTLGILRCLGMAKRKADLILIGSKKSFVTKSRYLNEIHCIDNTIDILTILLCNYNTKNEKPIIISCTDKVASLLDSNFTNLKNNFIFFNCGDSGKLTQYMDKQTQVNLAKEEDINTPDSYVYNGVIEDMIFPCIIKPLKSINGGKSIVICSSEEELRKNISDSQYNEATLIQQFIRKEYEIVLLGLSVNGQVIIPGYIHKYREYYGGTLYSRLKSASTLDSNLIRKCKKLIERMNYEGLFGIELIYDGSNYYFIETNLRNDATTYSLAVGGVNLLDIYVSAKETHSRLPDEFEVKEINSIVEFNDFKHRKHNNISILKWITQYIGAKCKYYFNLKDPIPFLYAPFKK